MKKMARIQPSFLLAIHVQVKIHFILLIVSLELQLVFLRKTSQENVSSQEEIKSVISLKQVKNLFLSNNFLQLKQCLYKIVLAMKYYTPNTIKRDINSFLMHNLHTDP